MLTANKFNNGEIIKLRQQERSFDRRTLWQEDKNI